MLKNKKKYSVIILAGGLSSRMGDFKALLPFDGMSAVEVLVRSARMAGIEDISIVTGHRADLLQDVIEKLGIREVFNKWFESGMFTSIQAGVAALANDTDAFFLLPVDYPLVPAMAFLEMIEEFEKNPNRFIVPCYKGKKGHPPLFPYVMSTGMVYYSGDNGLKGYTAKHEERMARLETDHEEIVMDMDTYEDYEDLSAHYAGMQTPDEAACMKMLKRHGTPEGVIQHSKAVTLLALKIARELNDRGAALDMDLIRSAGLLHDIARQEKRHWSVGADIVRRYGMFRTAELIENHMFYIKDDRNESIEEIDILCLADKQFDGARFVTLKERAMPVIEKWQDDAEAVRNIKERFHCASVLKARILKITGKTVEDIWKQALQDRAVPMTRRIFLIRHGQTRRHKEKIFLGQTDVPLSSQGREQAEEAADRLAGYEPKVTKIYCSDLKRAIQTAEIVALKLFCGRRQIIRTVPDFREMSLGAWDGMYISEVMERFPEDYRKRGENPLIFKIENDSENYYDLRYRVMKKLNRLIAEESDQDIVIVAHAGVNAVIRNTLESIPLEKAIQLKQEYGGIHIIDLAPDDGEAADL